MEFHNITINIMFIVEKSTKWMLSAIHYHWDTVNSKIIAFICFFHFLRMDKIARLIIAIQGKSAYWYMSQIPKCEFVLLRYSLSRNIHKDKNLAMISEFTIFISVLNYISWKTFITIVTLHYCCTCITYCKFINYCDI